MHQKLKTQAHRELLPCSELCPSLHLVTYAAWRSPRSVLSFATNIHLGAGAPVPLPRGAAWCSRDLRIELCKVASACRNFRHLLTARCFADGNQCPQRGFAVHGEVTEAMRCLPTPELLKKCMFCTNWSSVHANGIVPRHVDCCSLTEQAYNMRNRIHIVVCQDGMECPS